MGNFSRDTYRLTNTLYELLTGETVTQARHYVGVRLQQGVPMLDADWNELEDIRRFDQQASLRYFFGDGIPADNSGFQIGPVSDPNNFTINIGVALVNGMLTLNNLSNLTYADQAARLGINVAPLAPPDSGVRDDLVYLDIWEEEVGAENAPRIDTRLTNPVVGMETSRRLERRWVVRVGTNTQEIADIPAEAGHTYFALAQIRRVEAQPQILVGRITDRRRTNLNVSRYLKVPLLVTQGALTVDSERLAQLFDGLRTTFMNRLETETLFVDAVSDHARTVVYFSVQHLLQVTATGALQARTLNLNNDDALAVLDTLLTAQQEFLTVLDNHGNGDAQTDDFINTYSAFLTGSGSDGGLEEALANHDFIDVYERQQAINVWLSAASGALPEGEILAQFIDIAPVEPLVTGTPYTITLRLTSSVVSTQASERFTVTAQLSSDLWDIDHTGDVIELENAGGQGELTFVVTPNAANTEAILSALAQAQRNPTGVQSPPAELRLVIGEIPAVAPTVTYAGPPLNADNRLELNAALLTSGFGANVQFALHNSVDVARTYRIRYHLTLSGGADETGWSPVGGSEIERTVVVDPETSEVVQLSFNGPVGQDVTDTVGTFHVALVQVDGVDVPPAEQEPVDVAFIAV